MQDWVSLPLTLYVAVTYNSDVSYVTNSKIRRISKGDGDMYCDWCQVECASLVPIVNRNPAIPFEHEFVCLACAEVERFEHADELLWSPVTFESLNGGRCVQPLAA